MRVGVTISLLAVMTATGASASDKVFVRFQGVYVSSQLEHWLLKVKADGGAVVSVDELELNARPVVHDGRIGLYLPRQFRTGDVPGPRWEGSGVILLPRPTVNPPAWPPSLEDPTAPLVMPPTSGPSEMPRTWLTPVDWNGRLYLVEDLMTFCGEVRAGVEPRSVASGTAWLRQGDWLKTVKRRTPKECSRVR